MWVDGVVVVLVGLAVVPLVLWAACTWRQRRSTAGVSVARPHAEPADDGGPVVAALPFLRAGEPRVASLKGPARKGFKRDRVIGRDQVRVERQRQLDDLQRSGRWPNQN